MSLDINVFFIYYNNLVVEVKRNIGSSKHYPRGLVYKFQNKNILYIIIYSLGNGIN